jgi:hypothetical protein
MKQLINDAQVYIIWIQVVFVSVAHLLAQELYEQGSQSENDDVAESVSEPADKNSPISSQAKPKKSKRKQSQKQSPKDSDNSIDAASLDSGDDHTGDEHPTKKSKLSKGASKKLSSKVQMELIELIHLSQSVYLHHYVRLLMEIPNQKKP